MSRSFKRTPTIKSNDSVTKRKVNKSIRRSSKSRNIEDIEDGSFYKKINNIYDVSDYTNKYFSEDDNIYY